jgi:hypothetical protein
LILRQIQKYFSLGPSAICCPVGLKQTEFLPVWKSGRAGRLIKGKKTRNLRDRGASANDESGFGFAVTLSAMLHALCDFL